jgi:hypothetical protein
MSPGLPGIVDALKIEAEPMVFSATPAFAMDHGGPLTRAFLSAIGLTSGGGVIVDTRVHMLFPGHSPAIGGWHCDAVPRGADGQPDLRLLHAPAEHWTYTAASVEGLCLTEFAAEPVSLAIERTAGSLWSDVHRAMAASGARTIKAPHGSVVRFYRDTLHRATKADRSGWRFFARASEMVSKPQNKIRRQVQVYVESEGAGW